MRRDLRLIATFCVLGAPLVLAACAEAPPAGPTVMALPGQGRSLESFQRDDASCRGFAGLQTNYRQPGQGSAGTVAGSAGIGTAIGAAAGAALGAVGGNPGAGAAIGGGVGLLGGSSVGANNAAAGQFDLQTRYNIAYTQCMYARGNSVQSAPPGYGFGGYGLGYSDYGIPLSGYYGFGYGSPWGYPFYGSGFWGPSFVVGFGGGYGHRYGYYGRGYGYGWHGGGWHGGGWGGGGWGGGGSWHGGGGGWHGGGGRH